jgi:sterol desaturase/sphingolipid hydroxylase (fatty acid hydroxylase superfamily)
MLEAILEALASPFIYLGTAEKRVYAPAMVVALVLALWVYRRQGTREQRSMGATFRALLCSRVWFGRSARLDYQLLVTNALVRVWANASALIPPAGVAALVSVGMDTTMGPCSELGVSRSMIALVYTVSLFVVGDFSRYAVHLLFHRVAVLWELHKVHHSATSMTPFTVYRMHPIESFVFGLRGVFVSGMITGVFYYLFRAELHAVDLLGVNALGLVFNMLGANLRHSHVWLSYGSKVEHVLISPAQHQIHHSIDVEQYDRNFGSCFAIWDWVFGTLYVTHGRESLTFGVGSEPEAHHWWDAVITPMRRSLRRLATKESEPSS